MSTLVPDLLGIARDLTASLGSEDRYQRLLETVCELVPCDAAALLRLDGEELVPLAVRGLVPDSLGRRFHRREHPRLDIILHAEGSVVFPTDSPLADPFDGLIAADPGAKADVHSCLGCPLVNDGQVVGALTADALAPDAFDDIDADLLSMLGALAGAALRTSALIDALEDAVEHRREVARQLVREAAQRSGGQLIGRSAAMEQVRREIEVVARSDVPVLILGETGTGKELVARSVHAASGRADEPLIYVNCAALPETIVESELFGHVRGAFTSADRDREGRFQMADGGSIFLDEVGELPLTVQPKLLRVLQEGELQSVGSDRTQRVDVRVIAATNRDLQREVEQGRFRVDLYHRLAVFPLHIPPLRERSEDIPLLSGWFLDLARRRLGLGPVRLHDVARRRLIAGSWPGNVRELDNVLCRAVLHAYAERGDAADDGEAALVIEPAHIGVVEGVETAAAPAPARGGGASEAVEADLPWRPGEHLRDAVDEFQRRVIRRAVEQADGNWAAAARALGMHRSNLHHLATRLGLRDATAQNGGSSTRKR